MKFPANVRTTYFDISIEGYFNGVCPGCNSNNLKIRSSRKRTVPDLGSPIEKRIARIKMATFECNQCGKKFSPKHPDYPSKFEYSLAIIKYALDCYYNYNFSGPAIAHTLKDLHQVDIPIDTIHSWIKFHSDDYFKAMNRKSPQADPKTIKSIAIDGTFITGGKDVIGKKKPVDLLSLIRAKNGTYLLTWSRKKI